jgi:hypothetical protein
MSTRLVLRDRTLANADDVLLVAVDDLVHVGVWVHRKSLAGARRATLTPTTAAVELPEPLLYVDDLLRRVPAERADGRRQIRATARWIGRHARGASTTAVHKAIEDLVTRGYMERALLPNGATTLRTTQAGDLALAGMPPADARHELPRRSRRAERRVSLPLGGAGLASPLGLAFISTWSGGFDQGCTDGHAGGHHGGLDGGYDGGHHHGHDGGGYDSGGDGGGSRGW